VQLYIYSIMRFSYVYNYNVVATIWYIADYVLKHDSDSAGEMEYIEKHDNHQNEEEGFMNEMFERFTSKSDIFPDFAYYCRTCTTI
jgi:hypothetical protein